MQDVKQVSPPQNQKLAESIQKTPKFKQAVLSIADEFELLNYEKRIVSMICAGLSIPEISEINGYKHRHSIYKRLSEIYAKTKVQSRAELQTLVTHRLCSL